MKVAVIDLGYGDSGKGLVTNWLASQTQIFRPVTVRYSGGSQCGHCVRPYPDQPDIFHIFQTVGSGAFHDCATYLTEDVVFNPVSLQLEYNNIVKICGKFPFIFINPNSPVITPYDIDNNQISENIKTHGTCGKGIFTTKQREKNNYHLHAKDLLFPQILEAKMKQIAKYYGFINNGIDLDLAEFYNSCEYIKNNLHFDIKYLDITKDVNCIFESSQGLLIDENIGIFPHCTPSKLDLPLKYGKFDSTFLVTRTYHTRHGNGELTTEHLPVKENAWETNYLNQYQGKFRTGILNLDLLKYAVISSNVNYDNSIDINLVITHLDIVDNDWKLYHNNRVLTFNSEKDFVMHIVNILPFKCTKVYLSHSPFSENIKEFAIQ